MEEKIDLFASHFAANKNSKITLKSNELLTGRFIST